MSEVKEVKVPDIGDFDSVPVIEVLVAPGDTVTKEQGLVTLESDKATMEVPAPFAGTVREVKVSEGDEVGQGHVVALIESGDEGASEGEDDAQADAPAPAPAGASKSTSKPESKPETEPGSESESEPESKSESEPESKSASAGETDAGKRGTPPVSFDASVVMPDKTPYASPAVRAFARELGVDISLVQGSGRKGRVQRGDVQSYVKQVISRGGPATGAGGGSGLLPWPKVDFSRYGEVEEQPLSRIQKISARNLARNWAMIPHVTQHDQADITEMEAFRKQLGKENEGVKITPLVFLIKAVVAALKAWPRFNASLKPDGETLVLKHYFHIGIAVDTPNGLVVPVIRDCDQKGLLELANELAEVSVKARDGKLSQADISGGCFSISSLGGIGGTGFTPIVNAPEVAILGVSRAAMQPLWDGSEFRPRLMLPLAVSYDHRVIDGALAARFAAHLAKMLGDLRRLLV